jgi:hypothetical protein
MKTREQQNQNLDVQSKNIGVGLLFLFILFLLHSARAQDSHYNSQQPDSKGTLNGGTGTAGSRELSAIYYNPGIIAFFAESNIGFSGNLYTVDFLKFTDAAGANTQLGGATFQVIPSLVASTFKWKKNNRFTTSYAYLNNGYYLNRMSVVDRVETSVGVIPVNELYRYDVRTRFHEDWLGVGLSYRINENWGIGFVPFAQLINRQYMQRSIYELSLSTYSEQSLLVNSDFREARLFAAGVTFNIGVVYSRGEHEFGLNIKPPRWNLPGLSFSSVERETMIISAADTGDVSLLVDEEFLAIEKRPMEINIGYAWMRGMQSFKVRLAYYLPIGEYVMGKESDSSFRTGMYRNGDPHNFLPVSMARGVLNVGLGYEWRLHDKMTMITGFRSDFSYFDKSQFEFVDFTTQFIYWNLYHVSWGIDWKHNRLSLNTGFDYAFSYQKNLRQLIDYEQAHKPIDQIQLSDIAKVSYNQIKIFIGLVISLGS